MGLPIGQRRLMFMHAEGVRENTGFFNTGWKFVIFLPEHLEKTAFCGTVYIITTEFFLSENKKKQEVPK